MANHRRRITRLEQLHQAAQPQARIEYRDTDGQEFGLEPVDGGWVVYLRDGKLIKAYPKDVWTAWGDEDDAEASVSNEAD